MFAVNAALFIAAALVLALSPATISFPVKPEQLLVLAVGVVGILAANALLLRVSLRPLRDLSLLMRRIDLLRPGQRLEVEGARELSDLIGTFNQMLDRLERERQTSSSRSVGGQEEERRRLASELHDEVGQGLTALLLRLKGAIDDAPPGLEHQLLEVQALARENLDEVRRIARRLRPTVLDDLGLAYALHALVDAFEHEGGIRFERQIEPDLSGLSRSEELAVYRIAQEALTNAVRHAGASTIELALFLEDEVAHLLVRDDGKGMVPAADLESGGIRGMRERALAIGADLSIGTRPEGGTGVDLTIPRGMS